MINNFRDSVNFTAISYNMHKIEKCSVPKYVKIRNAARSIINATRSIRNATRSITILLVQVPMVSNRTKIRLIRTFLL